VARYTFKTRWRAEADNWSNKGPAIVADASLEVIQKELQERGPVIVEHWHYRGAQAPSHHLFEDWESFEAFLLSTPFAGDAIDVWSFAELCTFERRITGGKCPGDDGKTPEGGAY
jgi:hypothetical protein